MPRSQKNVRRRRSFVPEQIPCGNVCHSNIKVIVVLRAFLRRDVFQNLGVIPNLGFQTYFGSIKLERYSEPKRDPWETKQPLLLSNLFINQIHHPATKHAEHQPEIKAFT